MPLVHLTQNACKAHHISYALKVNIYSCFQNISKYEKTNNKRCGLFVDFGV